jgi:hypothetical protein
MFQKIVIPTHEGYVPVPKGKELEEFTAKRASSEVSVAQLHARNDEISILLPPDDRPYFVDEENQQK